MTSQTVSSVLIDASWHRVSARAEIASGHRLTLSCGLEIDTTDARIATPDVPTEPEGWDEEGEGPYTPTAPLEWSDSDLTTCPSCG